MLDSRGDIGQSAYVPDNAGDLAYFRQRGFDVSVEERDVHAEYMASGNPGRATFYAEGRRYYCVDLTREGSVVARHYADGESIEEALQRARQRFSSEQG